MLVARVLTASLLTALLVGCTANCRRDGNGSRTDEDEFLRTTDCVLASMPQSIQFATEGSPFNISGHSTLKPSDVTALARSVPVELRSILVRALNRAWPTLAGEMPLGIRSQDDFSTAFVLAFLELTPRALGNAHCGDPEIVQNVTFADISDWFSRSLRADAAPSPMTQYFSSLGVDGNRSIEFLMLSVSLELAGKRIPLEDQLEWFRETSQ